MDSTSFERLREIVLSVTSMPPGRREEALAEMCGNDDKLRTMALRMLRFDPGESALDQPDRRSGQVGPLTTFGIAMLDGTSPPPREPEALDTPSEPDPQESPPAADSIPGYRVIHRLGEGGMGSVYLAEDLKLGRRVALKFLRPGLIAPRTLARFIHEARAPAAIDHPNICTVYGIHEAAGQMFIAMAYVDGMTLQQRITSGPLAIDEAVAIAMNIARGLSVTHEKGIIHRDLKPSNVMLSNDGMVKIVDFGIAHSRDRRRSWTTGAQPPASSGWRMGTPAYMAPERLMGEHADHHADIWALGVVLFEMLTGRLPFEGDSDHALWHHIVHDRPLRISALRDNVPSRLDALIEDCLVKNPSERPDATGIAHVLEMLLRPPHHHAGPWMRPTAWLAALMTAAFRRSAQWCSTPLRRNHRREGNPRRE